MHPLVLFDLGDTLIYREKSLKDFDIELLGKFSGVDNERIVRVVSEKALINQGIYKFSIGGVTNEEEEAKNVREFFVNVFENLSIPVERLDEFLKEREGEVRYKVFPKVEELLTLLRAQGYTLGIASNGRPSRRAVLKQLGLMQYFDSAQIYISDEMGFCKPQAKFFEYVENHSGFDEYLLCDDEKEILEAASARGWKVIETGPQKDVYNEVLSILN